MTAKFILPEFYEDLKINMHMLDLQKKYPYAFANNTEVYGFYGNFSNVIWNGGRYINFKRSTKDEIQEIFFTYNNYLKIPLRLTFTNSLITEKECYDTYSNIVAELGHNGMNEILVNSPVLEEYLRKNYPNYKYCKSITSNTPFNTELNEKYYMEVLPKYHNNNWDFLNTISTEKKSKTEILCNDNCPADCKCTYSHYADLDRATLNFQIHKKDTCRYPFTAEQTAFLHDTMSKEHNNIPRDLIHKDYLPNGFQYFKLAGRTDPVKRLYNWIEYIGNPEYSADIFYHVIGCIT